MKRYIFIYFLSLSLFLQSCMDRTSIEDRLTRAESFMSDNPEQSLDILESVCRDSLSTRRIRARYALLYSMALDKNCIDIVSDSIIAPAVKYYRHHGTADDKLKANYYLGRIYQNAGDIEEAMYKFVEAEHYISNQTDKNSVARLYKAKMTAYQDVFDYESAVRQAHVAAEYYLSVNDTARYLNTINDIVVLYSQLDNHNAKDEHLDILTSNLHLMNDCQLSSYYAILLNESLDDSYENIVKYLSEYLSAISDESITHWLSIANAYIVLNAYEDASVALDKYLYYGGLEDPSYYWVSATLYEGLGQYDKALVFYKLYLQTTDNADLRVFESDTKFIEERYDSELKSVKQTLYIVIVSLILLVIVLVLIIVFQQIRNVKKEKIKVEYEKRQVETQNTSLREEMESMSVSLKAEIEHLKRISKDKSVGKDIIASIEQRMTVLNKFILAEFSASFEKEAYTELKRLISDREAFMESTRKTFAVSHPKFISYLRDRKLSEWEIGCCCLYCIGFNGSELSEFLNRKSVYNTNSAIRHKLGIPKGKTQIDVFLKRMMEHPN